MKDFFSLTISQYYSQKNSKFENTVTFSSRWYLRKLGRWFRTEGKTRFYFIFEGISRNLLSWNFFFVPFLKIIHIVNEIGLLSWVGSLWRPAVGSRSNEIMDLNLIINRKLRWFKTSGLVEPPTSSSYIYLLLLVFNFYVEWICMGRVGGWLVFTVHSKQS